MTSFAPSLLLEVPSKLPSESMLVVYRSSTAEYMVPSKAVPPHACTGNSYRLTKSDVFVRICKGMYCSRDDSRLNVHDSYASSVVVE